MKHSSNFVAPNNNGGMKGHQPSAPGNRLA
jgi:hypothetical protein